MAAATMAVSSHSDGEVQPKHSTSTASPTEHILWQEHSRAAKKLGSAYDLFRSLACALVEERGRASDALGGASDNVDDDSGRDSAAQRRLKDQLNALRQVVENATRTISVVCFELEDGVALQNMCAHGVWWFRPTVMSLRSACGSASASSKRSCAAEHDFQGASAVCLPYPCMPLKRKV